MTDMIRHPGSPDNRTDRSAGQSLVEFILVMPIFILVLIGGTYTAFNFYQAQVASDAIRQTATRKLEMAASPDAVTAGTLAGYINNGTTKNSLNLGAFVDKVTYADGGPYATFVIGNKQTAGVMNIIPGITIQVNQAINRNLLLPANAGTATVRPANTPWVPGGTPTVPPWEATATTTTTTTTP